VVHLRLAMPQPDADSATDAPPAQESGGGLNLASRSSELTTRALRRASESERIAGNAVTLLCDGPQVFASWLHDIQRAAHFILLENYIFSGDRVGSRIADALIARAQAGVEVYVLYDWFGSLSTSSELWMRMKRAGISVRAFQPFAFTAPVASLRRNHRKSLCIDGLIGHVGGLCIGDAWAGDFDGAGHGEAPWRDTALRFAGPAAAELCQAFDETWSMAGPSLPRRLLHARGAEPAAVTDVAALSVSAPDCPCISMTAPVRVIAGVPWRSRIYRLTQVLLANAEKRIWITDAYFLTPTPLYEALLAAARDGVDVRVLVPGRSDLPWIRWAGHAGFAALLSAGVKIYEWLGPMLHAKTMVVDGKWVRVGSSNLNLASLFTNWELDAVVEDAAFGAAMEEQFLRDLAQASELVLGARGSPRRSLPAGASQPEISVPGGTVPVPKRSRPGRAVARAGALVLGVALRRPYERSPLTLSMLLTVASLTVAVLGFLYPTQLGWLVAGLCGWLTVGALLRALAALTDPSRPYRSRRGRRGTPPRPAGPSDTRQSHPAATDPGAGLK
jgi:cardiolipin synthase